MHSSEDSQFIRLQKYLADSGVCSRRKAEDLITQGKVFVNGRIQTILGTKVHIENDVIEMNGQVVRRDYSDHVYYVLNKPRCVVTTLNDPEGRETVLDLCKGIKERIFPVGRLDYHSEGLLIMTNDGDLSHMIQHPSFRLTKVYEVKLFGMVNESIVHKMRQGISFHGEFLKPLSVRVVGVLDKKTWLEVRLQEGKNREIRKICSALGLTIDKLRRVAIEGLSIQGIAPGRLQPISKSILLEKLGINKKGEKIKQTQFTSLKKTFATKKIDKRLSYQHEPVLANDKRFYKFRKEHYQQTIQTLKEEVHTVKPVTTPLALEEQRPVTPVKLKSKVRH